MKFRFAVSGYNENSNALKLLEYSDKGVRQLDYLRLDNPSFVTSYKDTLFTYTKNPLKILSISTKGEYIDKLNILCEYKLEYKSMTHLTFSRINNCLYGASYLDGIIFRLDYNGKEFSNLKVVNHKEEYSLYSKCHAIITNEDETKVCCVNIATDTLYFYDVNLNFIKLIKLKEGCGPRHAIWTGDFIYCVTEYSNEIVVINYNNGVIEYQKTLKKETIENNVQSYCATLFKKGNYIYVSNRGEDTIAMFKIINEGKLKYVESFSVWGKHPRHMIVYKNIIITCNKNSHSISFIDLKTHDLIRNIGIPNPSGVCIL